MREKAILMIAAAIAVATSGCTGGNAPEIVTGTDKLSLQGNQTEQLEVHVKNNYPERPASFNLSVTSPEIVEVLNSESRPQRHFNMGEAASKGKTVKKVLLIRGKPEALGDLSSATDTIKLSVKADLTGNTSEIQTTAAKNVTVQLEK